MEVIRKNKIIWEVKSEIGYLKLSNPPQNQMDDIFFNELRELIYNQIDKSHVKAIIVSGTERHFSAGADLNGLIRTLGSDSKKENIDLLQSNYQLFRYFSKLSKPVIAAIRGVCLGSALELALHCHFRLCSPDSILGLPESTFDLIPGIGGIPSMMGLAGKSKTIELVLKGSTFNAQDALDWDIVDAIFPKDQLLDKAIELALSASENYRKYNKKEYLFNFLPSRPEGQIN